MRKLGLCAAIILTMTSLAACASNSTLPDANQNQTGDSNHTAAVSTTSAEDEGTEAEDETGASKNKEGKTEDIDATSVVKIITDEIKFDDTHYAKTDWASTGGYAVYDFSNADEIKNYIFVYHTDPDKYFNTDRILKDEEWEVTWNDDHTIFEQVNGFMGLTYDVSDVLNRMDQNESDYTAYLKDGSSIHVSYNKESSGQVDETTKAVDDGIEDISGNGKVVVPKNFVVSAYVNKIVHPFVLYRIGDEFMAVHHNDITFFVKDGDFYRCLLGEICDGSVEWDSEWDENLNLYEVFTNSEFEFFATLMDNNSYCIKYCSKTDETLDIVGINTVKYADEYFAFYINEDSGLCFRNDTGSTVTYQVDSYETECDAFPYGTPAH